MPAKAKQQTRPQVRQGKFYNCAECNAWCNDNFTAKCSQMRSLYMGRDIKASTIYYCNELCYAQTVIKGAKCTAVAIKQMIATISEKMDLQIISADFIRATKADQAEIVDTIGSPLVLLKAFKSSEKFCDMLLGEQSKLVLTEQFYKTRKVIGEALEEFNTSENITDVLCNINFAFENTETGLW